MKSFQCVLCFIFACGLLANTTPSWGQATYYSTALSPASSKIISGQSFFFHYDQQGNNGACMFGAMDTPYIAAVNPQVFAESAVCGRCLLVQGPKGTLKAQVVDMCPLCAPNQLDLNAPAFAQIADPSAGLAEVSFRWAACDVNGPIAYRYKENSSLYWLAIQVRNHRRPIKSLEIWQNGAFYALPRTDYNYFLAANGINPSDAGQGLIVRVTARNGQQLVDKLPPIEAGRIAWGAAQFN